MRFRERQHGACPYCKQRFALDPRVQPLRLNDRRFRRAVEHLSRGGTYAYTLEQLRYAIGRKHVQRQQFYRPTITLRQPRPWYRLTQRDLFVAGMWLLVPLGAGINFGSWAVGLALGLLVVVFLAWSRLKRSREEHEQYASHVAMIKRRQQEFDRTRQHVSARFELPEMALVHILRGWRQVYGAGPPGLLDDQQPIATQPAVPSLERLRAVLACSDAEVLRCLQENRVATELGLGLLPCAPPFSPEQEQLLAVLRARPELPLLLLRDASPDGCLLAVSLAGKLGLDPARAVFDLGIKPRQVRPQGLLELTAPVSEESLAALRAELAAGRLRADEFAWLEQGLYSPLVAVTPARLLAVLAAAVPGAAVAAQPAARQWARSVGFLTWPEEVT